MFSSVENSEAEDSSGSEDEENTHQPEVRRVLKTHDLDDRPSEHDRWMKKNLQEKLQDVLEELQNEHQKDAQEPDIDMSIVEDFKLKAILEHTRDEYFYNTPTALHIMAKCYSIEFKDFSKQVRRRVIRYLVENPPPETATRSRPSIVDQGHLAADPILMIAMRYNKGDDEFLEHVRDFTKDKFADLLEERDSGGRNSLHAVFGSWSGNFDSDERALTLRRAQLLVPLAKPTTITAKSTTADDGNTPLHLALDYRQVRKRNSDYGDIIRLMITKMEGDKQGMADAFNTTKDEESPILFHKRTKKAHTTVRKARQGASKLDTAGKPEASSKSQTVVPSSKNLAQKATSSVPPPSSSSNVANARPEKDQKDRKTKTQKTPRPENMDQIHFKGITHTSTGDFAKHAVDSTRGPSAHESSSSSRGVAPAPEAETSGNTAQSIAPNSKRGPSIMPPSTSKEAPSTKQTPSAAAETKTQNERPKTSDLVDFLEQHYIRTLPELAARDLIYGRVKASDINLSFDGTGLTDAEEIQTLIQFMKGGGGFSPTLASVRLPRVNRRPAKEPSDGASKKTHKPRANQKSIRSKADSEKDEVENPRPGRDELVAVFHELASAGVKTIMRLKVDDLEPLPHSDEAIEVALRPSIEETGSGSKSQIPRYFSIEEWDWKKPDLCIDVIEHVAPEVQKVRLYWSGNRSTLRGWSCAAGLPKLYWGGKRKLKTVLVYAAPGVEKRKRMQADLDLFKAEIEALTKNGVQVRLEFRMSGLQVSGSNKESTDGGSQHLPDDSQHTWIKHIENFRMQLLDVHRLFEGLGIPAPPRVKVALIDDGMDLGTFPQREGIKLTVNGLSCSSSTGLSPNPSPWYSSSQGHGTTMANMLLRVNPWISLYVMKLSDGVSGEGGGTTICAKSAAQGIRAAIARDVDIISMSWTLKQKLVQKGVEHDVPGRKDGMTQLHEAVAAAREKGIIMFCSASDDIEANARDSLPFGAAPEYILRIGAADAMGQSDPTVESKQEISYYFPGNKVALASNPRAPKSTSTGDDALKDGSSISTALAAGLASLIKYCVILVWTFSEYQPVIQQEAGSNKDGSSMIDRRDLNAVRNMLPLEPEEFKSHVKNLSRKAFMKQAFDNIKATNWPSDSKFLPVWGSFGEVAEKMRKGDHATKMKELTTLVNKELCSNFGRVNG